MRDGNRLKEKIELRLDQRQVVSFAMIALLLSGAIFSLGVLVGKNLASLPGGPVARPQSLLDRLDETAVAAPSGDGGSDGLTFQEELTKPREASLPKLVEKKTAKPLLVQRPKEAKADAGGTAAAPVVAAAEDGGTGAIRKPPGQAPAIEGAPGAPFFTVQVKATQSEPEADKFSAKLSGQGYHPFVADVNLPGKGHWYRVRVGHFDSRAKAEHYLADFERETHLQAFVTAAGH
ncbi:MAG: SPOR domain-containing protein [Myxococcales bacterium]